MPDGGSGFGWGFSSCCAKADADKAIVQRKESASKRQRLRPMSLRLRPCLQPKSMSFF
jgi:hypothetical protein